jgi:hypothetical protein
MFKLSILVHGETRHDALVKQLNLELQNQLNELNVKQEIDTIEVVFYLHRDKVPFKRKTWCMAHTSGEYYTELVVPFKVKPNYIKKMWYKIKNLGEDEKKLAEYKIFKRKPYQINPHLPEFKAASTENEVEDVDFDEIEESRELD